MKNSFINTLNEKQKEAVNYIEGSSLILAGAGSGKTRVLVSKVLNLIENRNIDPSSLIMITFTNKAANEMKERMRKISKFPGILLGYIGTFHSFSCMLLRRESHHLGLDNKFVIYDDDDQQAVIKKIIKESVSKKLSPSYIAHRISSAKNQLISPDKFLEVFSDNSAPYISEYYRSYENELKKNKALDFDDLIVKAVKLFIENKDVLHKYQEKFRYILVDEFQDTNYSQYLLMKLLGEKYANVTVVGDFSQSIYSWRGADMKNLEKFQEDFFESKTFYLEENYRSTQTILNFAHKVISKNELHPILELYTANTEGEEVLEYGAENEEDEAIFVANEIKRLSGENGFSSSVVLYRTNAQSRAIEEAFLHFGIPYLLVGGTRFYERKEIKDILSYLRLIINPNDEVSVERIKKIGKRKWNLFKSYFMEIKEKEELTTIEYINNIFIKTGYLDLYNEDNEEDYARLENIKELKSVSATYPNLTEFLQQVALVESEYSEGEKLGKNKNGVKLMTLHQAKGLEFPYVFIVGVEEGILPHSRSVYDHFQLEEERRLFYVGITRAMKKLYITYAQKRYLYGRRGEGTKSRFLIDDDWYS